MTSSLHVSTLVELIERRAREHGDAVAFTFAEREYTFAGTAKQVRRVAAALAERIAPGDRVVLALPNGPQFFAAFYGVLHGGGIPVPLLSLSGSDRIADLAAASGATSILLPSGASEQTLERLQATACAPVLTFDALSADEGDGSEVPPSCSLRATPDDVALLQYTSGSTGDPKGVVLTHANLLTNVRQMIRGMEITPRDVFVSWLPVHHDMGLILMTIVPFVVGARLVLLPSSLSDVRPWLRAIAEHRGTFTAAPDFAYRLCLRAVRDPSRFDLSSLRVALDAAEPVRAETIRRFEERFGLRRVMVAGYGLAEATVGVAMQPPGTPPVVSDRGLVAIGRPFPGIRLHIVGEDAEPVATGETGELVVESPANTSGYYRDPAATTSLFWRPGAIRTGDLAYRDAAGQVFLVGRLKNIIIQAGRNLAPQELEEATETLPFVRRAAAVGIDRGGTEGEQAHVFAELRRAKPPPREELQEMTIQIVEKLHDRLGSRPGLVALLRPGSIPRTPNGKIRHAELRAAYVDGTLRRRGRIVSPE